MINNLQATFNENKRLVGEGFGLHLDARGVLDSARTPHEAFTIWRLDCLARDRLAFVVSSRECEDNIHISIYVRPAADRSTAVPGHLFTKPRDRWHYAEAPEELVRRNVQSKVLVLVARKTIREW